MSISGSCVSERRRAVNIVHLEATWKSKLNKKPFPVLSDWKQWKRLIWRTKNGQKAVNPGFQTSGLRVLNLTWLGERNSWLFSLMYMLSPSNCGQMERRRLKFDWSDSWDKGKWFAYQTERGKKGKNNSIKTVTETRREKDSIPLPNPTVLPT